MKSKFMLMVVIFTTFLLSGCSNNIASPPSSSLTDRSQVDYAFIDVSDACTTYFNVDPTNLSTPCVSPKEEAFMFHTDANNWTIMCCEYSSKCLSDMVNVTSYNQICENNNDGKYNGYVYNDDGYWLAQCCNENGGSCYIDIDINTSDDSTVCDADYHQNTMGMNYNGTEWKSMCCIGGLENEI